LFIVTKTLVIKYIKSPYEVTEGNMIHVMEVTTM